MELAAYQSLRDSQDHHWWFVGRRRIVARLIERFVPLPAAARVLEAGCGYGGNLAMLGQLGEVHAFEFDDEARAHATRLAPRPVAYGRLPDAIGFDGERFDLVAMLDVLEHIDDDVASLRSLGDRLAPGGAVLLTVPAVPWLWSEHDVIHQHKRRYTRTLLKERLHEAEFEIVGRGHSGEHAPVAQRAGDRIDCEAQDAARDDFRDIEPPARAIEDDAIGEVEAIHQLDRARGRFAQLIWRDPPDRTVAHRPVGGGEHARL
jgi:SAM-dependent methyltransferase